MEGNGMDKLVRTARSERIFFTYGEWKHMDNCLEEKEYLKEYEKRKCLCDGKHVCKKCQKAEKEYWDN